MLKETDADSSAINLWTKRETSKCEPVCGQGKTCALVDVGAGNTSAGEARVARACEGAVGVCARRVGVAVVGPICDRGARPITSSVKHKSVGSIEHPLQQRNADGVLGVGQLNT